MNRILEALADDNLAINPATYNGNADYRKAIKVAFETSEALEKKLNDEDKKLFEKFRDASSDGEMIYNVDRFIRGYRVGALMMIEVFTGSADLVFDERTGLNGE